MTMPKKFKPGDQIVYVPDHAKKDHQRGLNHPDVEFGFVTSVREDMEGAFCRFFLSRESEELRTTANSESCNNRDLLLCSRGARWQKIVNQLMESMDRPLGQKGPSWVR